MTAWVLVVTITAHLMIVVPGIASEADCFALAQTIIANESGGHYVPAPHCYPYHTATVNLVN